MRVLAGWWEMVQQAAVTDLVAPPACQTRAQPMVLAALSASLRARQLNQPPAGVVFRPVSALGPTSAACLPPNVKKELPPYALVPGHFVSNHLAVFVCVYRILSTCKESCPPLNMSAKVVPLVSDGTTSTVLWRCGWDVKQRVNQERTRKAFKHASHTRSALSPLAHLDISASSAAKLCKCVRATRHVHAVAAATCDAGERRSGGLGLQEACSQSWCSTKRLGALTSEA